MNNKIYIFSFFYIVCTTKFFFSKERNVNCPRSRMYKPPVSEELYAPENQTTEVVKSISDDEKSNLGDVT